jgi:hypothetical protein
MTSPDVVLRRRPRRRSWSRALWLISLLRTPLPAQPAGAIDWHPDLPSAREAAAEAGKPLLVAFRCET